MANRRVRSAGRLIAWAVAVGAFAPVALRAAHRVTWSWWAITAPFWGSAVLLIVLLVAFVTGPEPDNWQHDEEHEGRQTPR